VEEFEKVPRTAQPAAVAAADRWEPGDCTAESLGVQASAAMKRWYFWVLAPLMLGSAAIMVVNEAPTPTGRIIGYGIALTLILATVGLANPVRFTWAWRGVAVAILLAYVSYAVSEFVAVLHGKPVGWSGGRGEVSLRNALLGLFFFGVPAARYVFAGRSGTVVDTMVREPAADTAEQRDAADKT